MNITVWLGPVYSGQVAGALLTGSVLKVVQVKDAASAQPVLARWRGTDGSLVPGMLRDLGLNPADVETLAVSSFSAGHNLAKQLTKSQADRALIRILHLADSAQSGLGPVVPQGYLDFARDAVRDAAKLFVATASTMTTGQYASSSDTLAAIVEKLSAEGFAFGSASNLIPADFAPAPAFVQASGDFLVLDYQAQVAHEAHVTTLAAPVWARIINPWWNGVLKAFDGSPPGPGLVLTPPAAPPPPQPVPAPVATAGMGSDVPWGFVLVGGLAVGAMLLIGSEREKASRRGNPTTPTWDRHEIRVRHHGMWRNYQVTHVVFPAYGAPPRKVKTFFVDGFTEATTYALKQIIETEPLNPTPIRIYVTTEPGAHAVGYTRTLTRRYDRATGYIEVEVVTERTGFPPITHLVRVTPRPQAGALGFPS